MHIQEEFKKALKLSNPNDTKLDTHLNNIITYLSQDNRGKERLSIFAQNILSFIKRYQKYGIETKDLLTVFSAWVLNYEENHKPSNRDLNEFTELKIFSKKIWPLLRTEELNVSIKILFIFNKWDFSGMKNLNPDVILNLHAIFRKEDFGLLVNEIAPIIDDDSIKPFIDNVKFRFEKVSDFSKMYKRINDEILQEHEKHQEMLTLIFKLILIHANRDYYGNIIYDQYLEETLDILKEYIATGKDALESFMWLNYFIESGKFSRFNLKKILEDYILLSRINLKIELENLSLSQIMKDETIQEKFKALIKSQSFNEFIEIVLSVLEGWQNSLFLNNESLNDDYLECVKLVKTVKDSESSVETIYEHWFKEKLTEKLSKYFENRIFCCDNTKLKSLANV
jgi:hypothetical protein